MKKVISKNKDDMLPEYDFSSGVRGKHFKAYRKGHTVKIKKMDGTTKVQYFTLEDGAVILEPDVQKVFPNSKAVNNALRSLITGMPLKPRRTKPRMKKVG